MDRTARFVSRAEVVAVQGAVVAVDVLRAFSTAAYAFAAGAREVFLVATPEDAMAMKHEDTLVLVMGEDAGIRLPGFDFSNSPVALAGSQVRGRTLVQRTSGGTQGVVAARNATRLWCASLVNASATAAAVRASGLGAPTYLLTGRGQATDTDAGLDDLVTAEFIESVRLGVPLDVARVRAAVATSAEAERTRALGSDHAAERDIELCTDVDRFAFALEVTRVGARLRLDRIDPPVESQ